MNFTQIMEHVFNLPCTFFLVDILCKISNYNQFVLYFKDNEKGKCIAYFHKPYPLKIVSKYSPLLSNIRFKGSTFQTKTPNGKTLLRESIKFDPHATQSITLQPNSIGIKSPPSYPIFNLHTYTCKITPQ